MNRLITKFLLPAAVALSALAAGAATADASDICVGTSPLCPAPTYTATAAGFASALAAAQDGSHSGDDRIILAAATYSVATPLSYSAGSGQGLDIVGQGDTSIIKPAAAGMTALSLDLLNGPGSSISAVKFAPYTGVESGSPYGLYLRGGDASNLTFDVAARLGGSNNGLNIMGGSIRDSKFTVGENGLGALFASDTVASNLTLTGDPNKTTDGIRAQGGSSYAISRSSLKDFKTGLSTDQGTFMISDSLIDSGAVNGGVGIWAHNTNGGAYHVGVDATNLTLVGSGSGQIGLRTEVAGSNTSTVTLRSSIFSVGGPSALELYCANGNSPSSTASVNVSYSLRDPALSSIGAGCVGSMAPSVLDRTALAPPFADAAARNFQLNAASPALDAGDPAAQVQAGRLDLLGKTRLVGAKDPCAPRLDMGAYEFQSAATCTASALPGATKTLKLGKPVGKFKIGKPAKAFKVSTRKPKSRVAITASEKMSVKLTLKKGKKSVKGSQKLTVPAGTSYLSFGGRFGGRTLPPGKYTLQLKAPGLTDAPKSVLNVIR